ncbi:MAG: transglutaminase-like domain-containing protein [Bacteroidota bacterium]|nr:transglutaminase-like domain-containing protein [Bacteroidota bacterium]
METLIKIENILGYTANNNPSRAIRSGAEYEELIPAPDWHEEVVSRNADVDKVVHDMQALIKKSAWQTKELSKRLLAKDIYTTCKNIWNFLFTHTKYKEDDKGKEQLRTPALSWYLRTIRGIDCDDFSIFASTILYNLGIPHYLRVAKYEENYFQHVYVVVPQTQKKYITIDAVLDEYDAEKQPTEIKDFIVMNKINLNGIDVTVLSGIEDDFFNELSGVLSGKDFEPIAELEGLGKIPTREEELSAVYNHLIRTRDLIRNNPDTIKQVEHPETFLQMIDYAITYWNTDKRDEALRILAEKEQELNELQGLGNMEEGYEEAQLFYGVEGLNGIIGLGKTQAKRGFFSAVKNVVQQAGQGIKTAVQSTTQAVKTAVTNPMQAIKNVAQTLVKYNPASVAVRAGVLLAMKTNFEKIAEKLKWGYLTEAEARANGFDLNEWKKVKEQLTKTEHVFSDVLQGNKEELKKTILTGRGGGLNALNGINEDLGVVVAAAATTSIAAAMPFIKKILDYTKGIDFKKLLSKVNISKLMQGKKQAEVDVANRVTAVAHGLPSNPSALKTASQSASEETGGEENNTYLPSTQKETSPNTTDNTTPDPEGESPITKVMDWVKENKGMTALIAGGLILAFSPGARKAIGFGGTSGKGRRRKGKKKKNPPKTISGAGKKKAAPKKKSKPRKKGKPKGRGGSTPTVTL